MEAGNARGPVPWHGIWVDAFHPGFKSPEQCDRLIGNLVSSGTHAMFVQVRKRGDAYFRNRLEPFSEDEEVPAGFDPLAYLLQRAHEHGIELHAWLSVLPVWRAEDPPPAHPGHLFHRHGAAQTGAANWFSCDEKGESRSPAGYFLDPGHPKVSSYLVDLVTDLVRQYPVDGIHLDHIRYPSQNNDPKDGFGVGYNGVSVQRFNQQHDRAGLPGRQDQLWSTWRQEQVTGLVRRLRGAIKRVDPNICLSAALIAWDQAPRNEMQWDQSTAQCKVFQNWPFWMREGLIDMPMPMNYFQDASAAERRCFELWIAFQKKHCANARLVFGLGAFVNDARGIARQLRVALAGEVGRREYGVAFYSYASLLQGGTNNRLGWRELCEILTTYGRGHDCVDA